MIMPAHDRRQALALLGACAFSSSSAWSLEPPAGLDLLPEAEFGPEDGATDLEAMEDLRRRLTAPVTIDGQGPFAFMVDTGTNRSIVSHELADQLNLPEGRPTRVHGITGERVVRTVKITRFGVGGRQAANLSMPALSARDMGGVGILGVDGLKNQRILFNLPAARLQIVRSGAPSKSTGGAIIPARRRFGQLTLVDTDLAGHRVSVLVDTGAESSIGNSALRRLVQSRPRTQELQKIVIIGATGETTVADFGAVPEFRLGPLTIRNLRVAYADLHPFRLFRLDDRPAMLMGMDIMRFFEEVELDFGRSEVRLLLPKVPYVDPAGDPRRS